MFKYLSDKDMILKLQRENQSLKAENIELKTQLQSNLIATKKMLRVDELTPEELIEMRGIYPKWQDVSDVKIGDYVRHNDKLYEVIQDHNRQDDWQPEMTPSLYKEVHPEGVIPEWKQPTGGHDAYNIGDKVIYKGVIWVSKIDGNTTIPDGDEPYNRYWEIAQ